MDDLKSIDRKIKKQEKVVRLQAEMNRDNFNMGRVNVMSWLD